MTGGRGHVWPEYGGLLLNRRTGLKLEPPPTRPPRRDAPLQLENLKAGSNQFTIRGLKGDGFGKLRLGIVRVGDRSESDIASEVEDRALSPIAHAQLGGDDVEVLSAPQVRLNCPISLMRIECP